eukprot:jgi/Astpho2/6799/fgenesh1_pg.00103_%23_24_t
MPTANVALADLVTAPETLNALTEQNSNKHGQWTDRQLEDGEQLMEQVHAAVVHLDSQLHLVACFDIGFAVGTNSVLPLLQDKLKAKAADFALAQAQKAQDELLMEEELAERRRFEQHQRQRLKQKPPQHQMAFPQSPAPELLLADDAELQPGADDVSSSEPGASIPGMAYQSRIYSTTFKYDPYDDTADDFNSRLGRVNSQGTPLESVSTATLPLVQPPAQEQKRSAGHADRSYHEQIMELWKRVNPGVMPQYAQTPPSTVQDHFKWNQEEQEPVNFRHHFKKTDFSEYTDVAARFMKGLITDKASTRGAK